VSAAARYYGYFIAVFAAMQFLFAPILGALSDQYGRRPVLLLSLFGAGLDYILLSFAPTLWLLFVGRIIIGITSASFTAANAYIADVSPPEKRAQNFGMVGAAFGLGFIIGPAIGGLLGSFGPRVPFMAAGVLTLVNWLYGFFILPESLPPENRRRFAWRNANPVASLGALGRNPSVLGLTAVITCATIAMQIYPSVWVLYTTYRFGWNTALQGFALALFGLTSAVIQAVLLRFLIGRLGDRRVLVLGLVFTVIGYLAYGLATEGWMMWAIIVATGLSAATQPAVQGMISNQVNPDEQGAIQGALASLFSVAGVITPLIATALFSYFTAAERSVKVPGVPFFLAAALALLGLILALRIFRRLPAPSDTAAAQG
jgi:DHA1 family tetracycline resistance protein-like MFS transporter